MGFVETTLGANVEVVFICNDWPSLFSSIMYKIQWIWDVCIVQQITVTESQMTCFCTTCTILFEKLPMDIGFLPRILGFQSHDFLLHFRFPDGGRAK